MKIFFVFYECKPISFPIKKTSFSCQESEKQKFKATLDYLVLKRVDLNSKDVNGLTALHYAAKNNNEFGAERLIKEWSIRLDVS